MDHETRSVEVNPSSLDVLRQIIVGKKIDVLIMDPMKNLYGGMWSSNEAVNVIYDSLGALAVELNIAIVCCAHTRKTIGNITRGSGPA